MQPLVALPLKRSVDVDPSAQIGRLIIASYEQRDDTYKDDIEAVVRARRDATSHDSCATTGRDLLLRWFHMVEMLELRFPELRESFSWTDVFSGKKIAQDTFAYEKASVAYNIAARLTQVAAAAARDAGPDAFKVCYTSLRQAAGMLDYVRDNFLHAPTSDMSEEATKLLSALCLAQASEVFVEKSIADKKSAALISKLAAHTGAAYAGVLESANMATSVAMPTAVTVLLTFKSAYYGAVAQMHRAAVDTDGAAYGTALVRLGVAVSLAKEAQRNAVGSLFGSLAGTMLQRDTFVTLEPLAAALIGAITMRQREAQRDNDMVYHELLPPAESLPQLERTTVATAISVRETFSTPDAQRALGTEVFTQLVPLQVTTHASVYSEEQAKLLRAEVAAVEAADADLSSALDALGLPHSLGRFRALDSADTASVALAEAPQDVSRWVHECASGMDGHALDAALARLAPLRESLATRLDGALADLADEDRECERQRVHYGHRWTQEPIASAARALRRDLRANSDALREAADIDAQTAALWHDVRDDAALLFRGEAAVRHAFRTQVSSAPRESTLLEVDDDSPSLADARGLFRDASAQLAALRRLPDDRAAMIAELKRRLRGDDISEILFLQGRSADVDRVIAHELAKHAPFQKQIRAAIAAQDERVRTLAQALRALDTHPGTSSLRSSWNSRTRARDTLIERLQRGAYGVAQVRETLAKAQLFYRDLEDVVARLTASATAFLTDRRSTRHALASTLGTPGTLADDLAALNMHPAPAPAPAPARAPAWPAPPTPMSPQFAPTLPPKPPHSQF